MKELLILGGGTAGSMMANKLVRALADGWRITVVDRDDAHLYQPGLLFLPFGDIDEKKLVRPRGRLLDRSVRYVVSPIDRIDPDAKQVALENGEHLAYDLLIIATGAKLRPDLTEGMTGRHWRDTVFDFYSLAGASALARKLDGWEGGRLLVNLIDMPIKCPVAPLEFAFLADAWLRRKGLREKTELIYVTPLSGAFTKPVASSRLSTMLEDRNIHLVSNFNAWQIEQDTRVIRSYAGDELDFDLLVTVPLHGGADPIVSSGLGDETGFVPTDRHTLQALAHPDIFVLGDATNLPASKAGAVAHFQGDVLLPNLLRHIDGRPLLPDFDGHTNCFVETGNGKAMLLDFNYETEPLPGRFPLPGIGPFSLLEESNINHLGKLAFEWVYWNVLVKGEDLPLDHRMLMAGKWRPA